jgi:hypothetical protein
VRNYYLRQSVYFLCLILWRHVSRSAVAAVLQINYSHIRDFASVE